MVKYISSTDSKLIKFNKETEEVSFIRNITVNLDWMWIVDEDGEINGTKVEKGDIVYSFYGIGDYSDKREVIIVKDDNLRDYYARLIEYRKENACKKQFDCDTCCESCCNG